MDRTHLELHYPIQEHIQEHHRYCLENSLPLITAWMGKNDYEPREQPSAITLDWEHLTDSLPFEMQYPFNREVSRQIAQYKAQMTRVVAGQLRGPEHFRLHYTGGTAFAEFPSIPTQQDASRLAADICQCITRIYAEFLARC